MKICGLTRLEDILLARDLGVWAVGFVFAPSPRRLTPAAARELVEAAGLGSHGAAGLGPGVPGASGGAGVAPSTGAAPVLPLTAGVFADMTAEGIARVVEEVGLDIVQLHGLGGPGGAAVRTALGGRGQSVLVIQAVPVASEATDATGLFRAVAGAREEADIVLLDTGTRTARSGDAETAGRFGGTGEVFPWRLARGVGRSFPLLVAGGIRPDNARTALREAAAWGVDVSSGVESCPGVKDARLVTELVARVKGERGR